MDISIITAHWQNLALFSICVFLIGGAVVGVVVHKITKSTISAAIAATIAIKNNPGHG